MIPTHTLGVAQTPDGYRLSLHEHNGEYSLKLNGEQLMSSAWTESELVLADEACRFPQRVDKPNVLIGGLGLGFTLKRVLELVGPEAVVTVAELIPEIITWNREHLGDINGRLLDDKRVRLHTGDVFDQITGAPAGSLDAILLDVDNGPTAMVHPGNNRIYDPSGLKAIHRSLRPSGRVAFWSAAPEPSFVRQLKKAGFDVEEASAKAYSRAKRAIHRIYTGTRRG